jgi:hypothetical protein
MNLDDKISAVICSCKTVDQLSVAHQYVKLARKAHHIGQHKYHFMYGVITALKGVLSNN